MGKKWHFKWPQVYGGGSAVLLFGGLSAMLYFGAGRFSPWLVGLTVVNLFVLIDGLMGEDAKFGD